PSSGKNSSGGRSTGRTSVKADQPGDQRKVGGRGFQLYPVGIHQFQLTAGGGRGSPGLHPHKTGGLPIFFPEFPEPVVEGGQGNAPGCAEFFLALPAPGEFLHQEGHLFSFVHSSCFYAKLWAILLRENMYLVGRIRTERRIEIVI